MKYLLYFIFTHIWLKAKNGRHWWIHSLQEENSQMQSENYLNKHKHTESEDSLVGEGCDSKQVTVKLNLDL